MIPSLSRLRTWFFLWLVCWSWTAFSEGALPVLYTRVTDLTATLDAAQQRTLESRLKSFELQKGVQLAVLIVPTTHPETIEQYSMRVAEQWKLGRKGADDGVLLLIAKNDRTVRIEVGYGVEGTLNDATCNRIIEETLAPAFRAGDFYSGISQGLERIMQVTKGEALPPPHGSLSGGSRQHQALYPLIIAAVVAGGILRMLFGALPGALLAGGLVGLIAWNLTGMASMAIFAAIAAFFATLVGIRGLLSGGYSGGRYGGGGGGFSGGGGGFGGGGASGRW